MRPHVILTALMIGTANAGDFRAIDLGAPCAPVVELEVARGSVRVPWKSEAGEIYAFSGEDLGQKLVFSYFCVSGKLFAGNYYFPVEPLETAAKSFGEAYARLVALYGKPYLDNTPWQNNAASLDPRAISNDPTKYHVSWKTPQVHVTAALMEPLAAESHGWRVFVVVSRPLQ